jgi:hypothetical protein
MKLKSPLFTGQQKKRRIDAKAPLIELEGHPIPEKAVCDFSQ